MKDKLIYKRRKEITTSHSLFFVETVDYSLMEVSPLRKSRVCVIIVIGRVCFIVLTAYVVLCVSHPYAYTYILSFLPPEFRNR